LKILKLIVGVILWPLRFVAANLYARRLLSRRTEMVAIAKGERFTVLKEFSTTALTHWRAPMTDGVPRTVPDGTILVVVSDSPTSKAAFICVPEDLDAFVLQHIPENMRSDPKFSGISLVLDKSEIGSSISEHEDTHTRTE